MTTSVNKPTKQDVSNRLPSHYSPKRWLYSAALVVGLMLSLSAQAQVAPEQVQLVGIFKDSAVLMVRGKQHVLNAGERSPEGVRLVKVERQSATVEINRNKRQLRLSRATARYSQAEQVSEVIAADASGHYRVAGSINGQTVNFLVDTGATSIAMNSLQAKQLGIDFTSGQLSQANTAGGVVKAYRVVLDKVKVGEIELSNVSAMVLEGIYPNITLLGMTFLKHVSLQEDGGTLVLTKKY